MAENVSRSLHHRNNNRRCRPVKLRAHLQKGCCSGSDVTHLDMALHSRSSELCSVKDAASKVLQTKSLTVQRLDGNIFRTFGLQPPTDYFYILKCRPSSQMRLLRHEEDRLCAEAVILRALRDQTVISAPRLIEYNAATSSLGSSHLITGPFRGSVFADVEHKLSHGAVTSIEKSVGQFMRHLSGVKGTAFGAIGPLDLSTSSWSTCFAGMMESILRDAEDALVSLPYDFIRGQVWQHRRILDQVTEPRLVLLETRSDRNIVVDLQSYTVSGILDFSTTMWGDPFMSDWFYLTSVAFVDGFGKLPNRTEEERIRQYLYTLYHALVAVVRHCYRPSEDGDEMTARKSLTSSLAALVHLSEMSNG